MWKFQVQRALKVLGQWEYITGTANQEAEDYNGKKEKALYLIIQCIEQRFMPMVMGSQARKDMWDVLCQHLERKTVSNKVFT